MNAKLNVEFPCGYKYNLELKAGIMDLSFGAVKDDIPDKCPLHGKNCPPKK